MRAGCHDHRRGFTAIEAVLAVALGAAVIALAVEALRFVSIRGAGTGERMERARGASFFLERLHRILRVPFRVVPTEAGFVVLHGLRRDPSGRLVWDETLFELAGPGELVVIQGGRRFEYEVDREEGADRIQVDLGHDTIVVRVPGTGAVGGGEVVVSPLGVDPYSLIVTREEAEAALRSLDGARGWTRVVPLVAEGSATVRAASFGPLPGLQDAEVGPGAGALRDGMDLEVAVAGIETRPLGRALLPVEVPPGLPSGDLHEMTPWFQEAGLPWEEALRVATLTRVWEEALRAGDRRGAAKALAEVDGRLRRKGRTSEEVIAVLGDASPVAAELLAGDPDAAEALDAAARGEGEEVRVSETLVVTDLGNLPPVANGADPAELDGVGGDPAAGSAPDDLTDPGEELGPPVVLDEPLPGGPATGGDDLPALPPLQPGENETVVDILDPGAANFDAAYIALLDTLVQDGSARVFHQSPSGVTESVTWRKSGGSGSPDYHDSMVRTGGGDYVLDVGPGDRIVVRAAGDFLTAMQAAGGAGKIFTID